MNIYSAFRRAWAVDSGAPAIHTDNGLTYTWADVDAASAALANLIAKLQLQPRATPVPLVAACVDKSVESLLLYLAALRAGCAWLPLNPGYRNELAYFLEDAQPSMLVCAPRDFQWLSRLAFKSGVQHVFTLDDQRGGTLLARAAHEGHVHEPVAREPGDLAAILYTSGTTGRSKGAMLSHGNLLSNAQALVQKWDWRDEDVLLHTLPIFHIHGLFISSHCALLRGTPLLWHAKFDPAAVLADLPRATVFMGVPTMYGRLMATPGFDVAACRDMRLFVSGSAPLLAPAWEAFRETTGHAILERYGMSEAGVICSNPCRESEGPRVPGSVGAPLDGVELRLAPAPDAAATADLAIGDVEVRGPGIFSGYLGMPEKTRESFTADGWFRTGDVGRLDERGYLHLVGRARDLIITGGFNVYPAEVEDELNGLEGVAESAVFGVPHPDFGEGVVAVVVPSRAGAPDEAVLIAALRQRIATYKVPKRVFVAADLPRNAMGKVLKNRLQQIHHGLFSAVA